MQTRLSDDKISITFSKAIQNRKIIGEDDTAIIFYDLSFLEERIRDLVTLFPSATLHGIAVKANPLYKILERMNKFDVGLEAATLPELYIAANAGYTPDKIVFDSPTKTIHELEYALALGVHINADSLSDLDRISIILKDGQPKGTIGVRINPQVGTGKILSTSVAGEYSKFGVPLKEYREELIEIFMKYRWLRGVHLHIGSQGISLEQLLLGLEKIMEFVYQVNGYLEKEPGGRKIDVLDIGGGLPISYDRDIEPITMAQYQNEIKKRFPELFGNKYKLITEFGRYIHTNTGWVASRVENVKRDRDINTAMIHVGADLFLRECYNPNDWHHEITVLDPAGNIKSGQDENKYMIAGPLCFAGDLVAREITLPKVEVGDYIIIHDAGAYTLGMWSRYNSRQVPKVVGYYLDGNEFEVIKERESIEKILEFWA
jgi:diaminopimelate decarboxylase